MRLRLSIAAAGLCLFLGSACGRGTGMAGGGNGGPAAEDSPAAPPIAFGPIDRSARAAPLPGGATRDAESATGGVHAAESAAPTLAPSARTTEDAIDRTLSARIERAVANAVDRARRASQGRVTGREVAVSVVAVDSGTGAAIVRRQSKLALVPASNLKLLTVAAALSTMGADGAFVTRFESDAEVARGVLRGDLVALAGGDPLYRRDGTGSLDAWLDPLADALRSQGIERIDGALVLDEGGWLDPGPGPEWPGPSQHWTDYCALAGGFSANAGCFRVTITPASNGRDASVDLRPRHHGLVRKGRVVTDGKTLDVAVGANRAGVTVRGKIAASLEPYRREFSHPDPVDLFGHVIVGGLLDRGIAVSGGFVRARDVPPSGRRLIYALRTPIRSVLDAILLDSNNPVADQLFLAAGAHLHGVGTRESGAAAVRAALQSLGIDTSTLVQVDGSGLSKSNRITAEQLAALVHAVVERGGEMRDAMLSAMPRAGVSGSLAKRMRDTPAMGRVRAKTGWVMGASSLSGIAETLDGREIVFSILVRYPRAGGLNTKAWKPMQDEICVALVESGPAGVPGGVSRRGPGGVPGGGSDR